jgi:thiol:disulfide interchange protein DsbA
MFPKLRVSALAGVVAACLLSPVSLRAADEGIDYVRLPVAQQAQPGDKVEVLEFFWYGCPHCWHLEPAINAWKATMPEGADFQRMPATGPRWEPHARAYYAAELMGKLDAFHEALFKAMQVDKRRLMSEDDLVKFAGEIGIDEQEFREVYRSFTVDAKVRKAADLGRRYGIDGVPAVVINGKYRTSPSQTGTQDRFIEVMNTLVSREIAARQAAVEPVKTPAGGNS